MFTSTFGIPHRPIGAAHASERDDLGTKQHALLRVVEQALRPAVCGAKDRPCSDCDACQLTFSF
jgi:hypothetical protein